MSSLKKGHVEVNNIETVLESLVKIETVIENQLKVLTDVAAQVDVQVDVQNDVQSDTDDDSDDSSSSSDDEEASINKMTEFRSRQREPNFLSSYLKMIDAVEFLICCGAEFQRGRHPSSITLVSSNESISFERGIREEFRATLLPLFECMKLHVKPGKFTCIYRFRCDLCAGQSLEFDYVGQARDFDVRYKTHQRRIHQIRGNIFERPDMDLYIDYLDWSKISKLYAHEAERHSSWRVNQRNQRAEREIFSAYVVHRLPNHGQNNSTDSSVRRSWEIFYQWLYKAMVTEGGGSQR